jgi:predicted metal-dependent peptidase
MQKNSKLYTALVILTDGYHEFMGKTSQANAPIINKPVLHILTTNGAEEKEFKHFYKTIKMQND